MKNKQKILLTGASGTIGHEILKQLCESKDHYEITVFGRKSRRSVKAFKPYEKEIKIVYGDINDPNDLMKVCTDKDVVMHLLGILPPLADEKPKLAHKVNVLGTENLIRHLEQYSPNAFFLYSSSISVYGDRLENPYITIHDKLNPSIGDEYAKSKILVENVVKSSKLDWSILRLTVIMGGHTVSKIMFRQPLETPLEIATVEDTARAFINAIDKRKQLSNKIFNLGGGEKCRITYGEFLSRMFHVFGLGKLDFPPKTFAEYNFSCGYYKDGDELEEILNFRRDTLETYFEREQKKITIFLKTAATVVRKPFKIYLKNLSEPLKAFKNKDENRKLQYFKSDTFRQK